MNLVHLYGVVFTAVDLGSGRWYVWDQDAGPTWDQDAGPAWDQDAGPAWHQDA